jgi:prophage antirepressor-like protein
MPTAQVVPFHFEFHEVRTLIIDGNPWFVAKDVCEYFRDTNYRRSVARLDDDEKGVSQIDTPGGRQQMTVVNESGFYSLLFWMQPEKASGKIPETEIKNRRAMIKKIRKWITAEVLPTIRKTGAYHQPGTVPGKPESLLIVAREFRAAVRIARAAGLRDAEAVLAADKLTNELTGFSPVALLNYNVENLPEKAL